MVGQEYLESLDFMLWLSGSYRATKLTHTNQSTVIRRGNTVLSIFGTDIERCALGWSDRGDTDLLRMERAVHQKFRFRGRRPLRLHTPLWSHQTVQACLPRSWITNPAEVRHHCENPLQLLRERVIDACLLTPTQLVAADDLLTTTFYSSSIDLTLLQGEVCRSPASDFRITIHKACDDPSRFGLTLLPFLPGSCLEATRRWFQATFRREGDDGSTETSHRTDYQVAFLTPEMRRDLQTPLLIDDSFSKPYTESLVVLVENAAEPSFLNLVDALMESAGRLGQERGDTALPRLRR